MGRWKPSKRSFISFYILLGRIWIAVWNIFKRYDQQPYIVSRKLLKDPFNKLSHGKMINTRGQPYQANTYKKHGLKNNFFSNLQGVQRGIWIVQSQRNESKWNPLSWCDLLLGFPKGIPTLISCGRRDLEVSSFLCLNRLSLVLFDHYSFKYCVWNIHCLDSFLPLFYPFGW